MIYAITNYSNIRYSQEKDNLTSVQSEWVTGNLIG